MEIYRRKILSNRVITSIDTDGDGQDDAITLAQLTPVNIQFYLKENIDNMGLFTDFVEEVEIIDIDNIWDLENDGAGDGVTSSGLPDLTNPYDDDTISTTGGVLPAYCTYIGANNYFDAYGAYGDPYSTDNLAGTWVECVSCCNFSLTAEEIPSDILWTGPTTGIVYIIRNYESQTAQSCKNEWGGHAFLPSTTECAGGSNSQSQCGYPQALHMAREFCGQSTEAGATAGDWSLLEFTNETNSSYNGVGTVSEEITDTASLPGDPSGPPFGGPNHLSTEDEVQTICWNEMTTSFKTTIANKLDKVTHPTGQYPYNSTWGAQIQGSCNNCKLSGIVGSGKGGCVDNTNIVNGIAFQWLNYPQSGKGCSSSYDDCNAAYDSSFVSFGGWATGHQRYYNNQSGGANWDNDGSDGFGGAIPYHLQVVPQPTSGGLIGGTFGYRPTINNCGSSIRHIYFYHHEPLVGNVSTTSERATIPKIGSYLYTHKFSFNCKKQL